jgi:hypothetical protein
MRYPATLTWVTSVFVKGKRMVDTKKLFLAAAAINSRYGHATKQQADTLYRETHGAPLDSSRKSRRVAKAKMKQEMFHDKPEFTVPELEEKAA